MRYIFIQICVYNLNVAGANQLVFVLIRQSICFKKNSLFQIFFLQDHQHHWLRVQQMNATHVVAKTLSVPILILLSITYRTIFSK